MIPDIFYRQNNRIDRTKAGIRYHQRIQVQRLYNIFQQNLMFFVPADGTDNAAASLYRDIIEFALYLVKIFLFSLDQLDYLLFEQLNEEYRILIQI